MDDNDEAICTNLRTCFSTMFDLMFKNDGGFTGYFALSSNKYVSTLFTLDIKSLFDFVYNFVVLILVIEILSGIIIDTFAELR